MVVGEMGLWKSDELRRLPRYQFNKAVRYVLIAFTLKSNAITKSPFIELSITEICFGNHLIQLRTGSIPTLS